MTCEFISSCIFYDHNRREKPVTMTIYRTIYCDLDFERCARNIVARELGHDRVPIDLNPNHTDRLKEIIGTA